MKVRIFLLSLLALVVGSVSAQEPIVVDPTTKGHCNIFTRPVHIPDFVPGASNETLVNIEIPESRFGGCYDTIAEALYVGSQGGIIVSEDATMEEVRQAIEEFDSSSSTSFRYPTFQSGAVAEPYAIGYDLRH